MYQNFPCVILLRKFIDLRRKYLPLISVSWTTLPDHTLQTALLLALGTDTTFLSKAASCGLCLCAATFRQKVVSALGGQQSSAVTISMINTKHKDLFPHKNHCYCTWFWWQWPFPPHWWKNKAKNVRQSI